MKSQQAANTTGIHSKVFFPHATKEPLLSPDTTRTPPPPSTPTPFLPSKRLPMFCYNTFRSLAILLLVSLALAACNSGGGGGGGGGGSTPKDTTAPELTKVSITSSATDGSGNRVANNEDSITVSFTVNENLAESDIQVLIQGQEADVTPNGSAKDWKATYKVTQDTPTFNVQATEENQIRNAYFVITAKDSAGNERTQTKVTDESVVKITLQDTTPAEINGVTVDTSNANNAYAKKNDTITVTVTASEYIKQPTFALLGGADIAEVATATSVINGLEKVISYSKVWELKYTVSQNDTNDKVTGAIKDIRDAADNTTDDYAFDSSIDIDTQAPGVASITVTSDNTADTTTAETGNTITADFTTDEQIDTDSVTVLIQGQTAKVTRDPSSDNHYTATYTVEALTPSGVATVAIGMTDLAGNKRISSATPYTPAIDIITDAPKVDNVAISGRAPDGTAKDRVKTGDIVTVSFDSSVDADATQQAKVTIAGEDYTADLVEGSNSFDHTVDATDPEGPVAFTVVILNKSTGEPSTLPISSTTNGSRVIVDRTKPQVEVAIATTGKEKDGVKYAKEGNTITLTLTANEELDAIPNVALSYGTVTPDPQPTVNPRGPDTWIVKYQVPATDTSADGNDLEYTITYSDIAGNDNTTDATQDTVRIDTVTPTLSNISFTDNYVHDNSADYSTDLVVRGSEITLTFKTSETLKASDIQVTIDGETVTVSEDDTTTDSWKATYTVPASATFGSEIGFTIDFADPAGNMGKQATDNSADNAVKARYVTEKDPGKPVLEAVTVYSDNSFKQDYATRGNTVTIDFTADRALQSPQVVFSGAGDLTVVATRRNGNPAEWTANYDIPADSTADGVVSFTIDFTSDAVIRGVPAASGDTVRATTDGSTVTIDTTPVDLSSLTGDNSADYITIKYLVDISADDPSATEQNLQELTAYDPTADTHLATDRSTDENGRLELLFGDIVQIDFTTVEALGDEPVVSIFDLTSDITAKSNDKKNWSASYAARLGGRGKGHAIANIAVKDHIGNDSDADITTDANINIGPVVTVTHFAATGDGNPGYARENDTITLTFNLDETVDADRLEVTIAGQTPSASQTTGDLAAGTNITYTYQVTTAAEQGAATVVITLDDASRDTEIEPDEIFNANSVDVGGVATQIVIDTILPEVSGLAIGTADTRVAGKVTNGGTITIAITTSETVTGTPTVTIAGQSVNATGSGTSWNAQLELIDTVNLTDATYDASNIASLVAVSLTDPAGNTGTAINGVTGSVIVDRTAPGIADTPAPTYVINPDSGGDGIAQHGDVITFTFTTTEPIKIPVVRFGSVSASTIASGNADRTQWIATRTIRDSEDSRVTSLVISVDLSDDLNNTASDLTRDSGIEVQAGAPRLTELSMTSSNANSTWAKVGDVITVTIATTENILVTSVMVAGKEATIQNSGTPAPNWTATITVDNTFTQGGASIAVTHTTPSKEESSTSYALIGDDTTAVSIDTIPPTLDTVSLTTPANGAKVRGDVVLALTFSEEPVGLTATVFGENATITDGASAAKKTATIPATSLTDGIEYTLDGNTVTATFTDAAGNNGSVVAIPENASFIVDTRAPLVSNFTTSIQTGGATGTSDGDTAYHGAVVQIDFSTDENSVAASTSVTYRGETITVTSSNGGTAWSGFFTVSDQTHNDVSEDSPSFTVTTADDIDNTADTTQTGTVGINTATPTGTAALSVEKTSRQDDVNGRTTDGYAREGDTIKVAISGIHGQYEARNPQITIGADSKTGNDLSIDTSQDGIYEISYVVQSGDNGVVTFRVDLARNSGATARTINTATPATDVTVDADIIPIMLTGATSTYENLVKVNDVTLSVTVPDDLAGDQLAPIVLRVTKDGQEIQTITVTKPVNANTTQLTLTVDDFQELTSSGNLTISFDVSATVTDLAGNKIGFTGSVDFTTYVSASDIFAVESYYQEGGKPASRIGAGDLEKTDLFAFRNLENGTWRYSITVKDPKKTGFDSAESTRNVSNGEFSLNPFSKQKWMEYGDDEGGNSPLSVDVVLTHTSTGRMYTIPTLQLPQEQYLLKSWQDVQGMDYDLAGDYTLMNDIAFPNPGEGGLPSTGFTPIGEYIRDKDEYRRNAFTGSLNGNGKVLSNFFIIRVNSLNQGQGSIGLFVELQDATVDNLELRLSTSLRTCRFRQVALCGGGQSGGIAGYLTNSIISNSSVHGNIIGPSRVGALAGQAANSIIRDSHSSGEISVSNGLVGGLVGRAGNGTIISNSYSTASVSGGSYAGGLVGRIENDTATDLVVTIRNSFASGDVRSSSSYTVGGLVGESKTDVTIINSYARSDVFAQRSAVGGLLGFFLVNQNANDNTLTITNSYATGHIDDGVTPASLSIIPFGSSSGRSGDIGGLIGKINDISNVLDVTSTYWDTETTTQTKSIGGLESGSSAVPTVGTGKTTQAMKVQATYSDWDFTSVWGINAKINDGYPYLRGVGQQPADAKQLLALSLQADTTADAKTAIDEGGKTGAVQLPANTDTTNIRIGYIWIAGASASHSRLDSVALDGSNQFTITVTDASDDTQDYTITVTSQ